MRPPDISAEEMAKFNMRPSHDRRYRLDNLAKSEEVYGKQYANEVRMYMNAIQAKRKGVR